VHHFLLLALKISLLGLLSARGVQLVKVVKVGQEMMEASRHGVKTARQKRLTSDHTGNPAWLN